MMKIEIRNDSVYLEGYVNAVDRDSRPIPSADGNFIEKISPGAFGDALKRAKDVDLLLDHNRKIGSLSEKNLILTEDSIGLRAKCVIKDSEVIEKARKKLLRGWSFGFQVLKQRAEEVKDGVKRRIVEQLNLYEVSIIDDKMMPCYAGTSIEQRSSDDGEEIKKEIRGCLDDIDYKEEDIVENVKNKKDNENFKRKIEYLKLKNTW